MTERDTPWPPGTPCWVDLMTSDLDAARQFYGELFGWQLSVGGPETGGYTLAEIRGRAVAGLGAMQPGAEHPPVWTTYLASDDAAATAERVTAAGGKVNMAPMDVMGLGVMAVAADPTGGVFGIWQAGTHIGFALAQETGTAVWNELMTRDYATAKDFYAAVFGYTYTDMSEGGFQYWLLEVDGNTVGGLGALPADTPAAVPAHWRNYFAVDDADAALAQVERTGGRVLRPAEDMPYGRWGDAADPQGATFSLIKPAPGPA